MSNNGHDGSRTDPLYTIAEAAHLIKVHPITVRRWCFGYNRPEGNVPPILGEKERVPLVSFLDLAEIIVASSFRRNRLPLPRIRMAHDFAQEQWGLDYPFASLKLEALGGHVMHLFDEQKPGVSLATLDTKLQQWTLPGLVKETLRTFDYDKLELAERWYPIGKTVPIVVDPRYSAGLPTILKRRVTIETIRNRFQAGYSIPFISVDLKLRRELVEEAIRWDKVTV